MALSVKHTLQTAIADDPAFDVSSSEWNADHSMTGALPVANGGTDATDAATARSNLGAADKTTTITAGNGLTGGGDLSINRAFAVGAGTGITVNSDDVALTTPVAVTNGGTGTTTGISTATQTALDAKVAKAGDVMTGTLTMQPAAGNPIVQLIGAAGTNKELYGRVSGLTAGLRWVLRPGNATAESGSNAGSDFNIISFTDAGGALDTPVTITRSTGLMTVKGDPTANLGVATKQYADGKVAKTGDTMSGPLTATALTASGLVSGDTLNIAHNTDFSSGDLNSINSTCWINGANMTNAPDTGWWFVATQRHTNDNGYLVQQAMPLTASGRMLQRHCLGGGWGAWVEFYAAGAATAAEYVGNTAPTKMLTSGAVWTAAAPAALTESASAVTPNLSTSIDFTWTLGGAGRTINNPSNLKAGQKGVFILTVGSAGTITTWGSAYKFPGGVKPTLTANGIDIISYIAQGTAGAPVMYCTHSGGFA